MEARQMQNDELCKQKKRMIENIMNTIQVFYSNSPDQSIPQRVKRQVIPMLIDAYFKNTQEFQNEAHQNSASNQKNKQIYNANRAIIVFLVLQSIIRRKKVQIVNQIVVDRRQKKRMLKMLINKSMSHIIRKVVDKFVLKGRLVKLQLQSVKVIDSLMKRKKLNHSKYFFMQAKSKLEIKNPQSYHDLHLMFQSLYIKRMIDGFKHIKNVNSQANKKNKMKIVNSVALKTPLILQSSLWRLKHLVKNGQNVLKLCQIISRLFLKICFNKMLLYEETFQVKNQAASQSMELRLNNAHNKQNVLIQIASNVIQNKIFQRKLESFINIEKSINSLSHGKHKYESQLKETQVINQNIDF